MIRSLIVDSEEPSYPYLGQHDGIVVLFIKSCTGTCVWVEPGYNHASIGDSRSTWVEDNFKYLKETIELVNL